MTMRVDLTVVQAEPLRPEAFTPYGTVIQYSGEPRRQYVPEAFERIEDVASPTLWLRRANRRAELPVTVTNLERHPYSAQTFLPVKDVSHLVVVAGSRADGTPDLDTLRAFIATGGQGVSYRRNVWHHGLTVLDGTADFIVVMSLTGRGDDDVFLDLAQPVEVRAPAGQPGGSHG